MARVNVYESDEYTGENTLVGWYNDTTADCFDEDTEWDGSNHISVATGSQFEHQMLYRTKGGRWVLHGWSNWQGSMPTDRFIGDDEAKNWLLRNNHDQEAERFFGDIPEESGPGRPEIGGAVHVRLGELIGKVDAYAADHEIKRAEAVRQLVAAALNS